MDWKIQPGEFPKIEANRLVGYLPAASGPCPECGRPATWATPGGEPVVQHHDPIEHAACPVVIRQERARRMIVEGAKSLYLADFDTEYDANVIQRTVRDLAAEQRTLIDTKLMALPPGYRLCMHDGLETLSELNAAFSGADTVTFRVRQRGHVLEPGEACRHHGTRTEYGWPAGAIVERLAPCGRRDDCRVIEAADGTRYWFRSRGCPVEALPAPPWSDLDEWAADAWRHVQARGIAKAYDPEAFAATIDAWIRDVTAEIMTAEPTRPDDDESLYDKIARLYRRYENPYRWAHSAIIDPDPGRYLGGLDKP